MVCHLSINDKIHTFDAHYLMTGVGHELGEYVTKLRKRACWRMVFLLSDRASLINGTQLPEDGDMIISCV
ncbi:hypothetical protein DPMN_032359 [Dreissena polymorpha]|uniref:Uncharacterized protein n=1 Tax=Dreissena polymorpha TaxID=45954 RepID=A0A9D4M2Q4_DREPO|nr:hypothetical protein DPMN_032359 [Dreissena polymorpha]